MRCTNRQPPVNTTARPRPRRGFMLLDAVFGLALIAMVITILSMTTSQHRRGAIHFAIERELVYEAEHVLTALQQGQPVPPLHADSAVTVTPLSTTDAGLPWVEVRIERGDQSTTLVGWAREPIEPEPATP